MKLDSLRQFYRKTKCKFKGIGYPRYHDSSSDLLSFSQANLALSNKKVLFLIHWFEIGGAEFFALSQMKDFYNAGNKIFAISTDRKGSSKKDLFKPYCQEVYSMMDEDILFPESFIIDLIKDRSIDAVYIHHSSFGYQLTKAIRASFNNILILDSLHIVETGGGFVHQSAKNSEFIDYHHVISKSLGSYLVNKFLISPEKVIYFPLSYMSLDLKSKNYPSNVINTYRIVFFGRYIQQKRPYYFIEIAKMLTEHSDINFEFEMFGSGPLLPLMEKLVKAYNLKNIKINGEVSDKEKVFAGTYALLITSDNEGIPLVCYESIRSQVLCFSTDSGQTRDFLVDDFLVEASKPRDLVSKILKSINNPLHMKEVMTRQTKILENYDKDSEQRKKLLLRNFY